MSTLLYGLNSSKRAAAAPGESEKAKPPGTKSYLDTIAALVPAEVLAVWAGVVLPNTTKTSGDGENVTTTISDAGVMRWAFFALLATSIILYIFARLRDAKWDKGDYIRMLIPPASFAVWMLLQRPSVFDLIWKNLSSGGRDVLGAIAAVLLAGLASALAYKLNDEPAKPK